MEEINLKEIRENITKKIPVIMERGICNFSQLSSFEHYDKIIEVVKLIGEYGNNMVCQFDSREEFLKFENEHFAEKIEKDTIEFDKAILLAKELNEKINIVWNIVFNKTVFYYADLEQDKINEKYIKDIDSGKIDISVIQSEIPVISKKSEIQDGW